MTRRCLTGRDRRHWWEQERMTTKTMRRGRRGAALYTVPKLSAARYDDGREDSKAERSGSAASEAAEE